LWFLVCIASLAVSCKTELLDTKGHDSQIGTTKMGALELDGKLQALDKEIVVSCRLINRGAEDLYIFDALYKVEDDKVVSDPALIYTVIQNQSLTLFKGVLEIPEGLQVEIPDVPYGRLLKSGQQYSTTFSVPVPVPYNNPYDFEEEEGFVVCEEVRFRIGYAGAASLKTEPKSIRLGAETLHKVRYHDVIGVQQFVETAPRKQRIAVLKKQ
jgi:hypothetical protein